MNRRTSRLPLLDLPISAVLGLCFAFWPLFSNLWTSFSLTASIGGSIPLAVMGALAICALVAGRGFKRSYIYWWFLFVAAVAVLTVTHSMSTIRIAARDFLLILFCCIVCIMLFDRSVSVNSLLRCIYLCGLFISFTVVLDKLTGIFSQDLIGLYTTTLAAAKARMSGSGGILVHLGTAGGYICPGAAAYFCLRKQKGKVLTAKSLIVFGLFLLAFIIIHKRGFALDMAIAPVLLWIFGWGTDRNKTFNPRRSFGILISLILVVAIVITVYFTVPFVRTQVDGYLGRFDTEDDTLSGRTKLYLLAWNLFKENPVFGIGWGRYRSYSAGIFGKTEKDYAAHNIYLQLLAETGVVGTVLFLAAVGFALLFAMRQYRRLRKAGADAETVFGMQAGLFLQLFFLLYGMSGNPLYDDNFLVSYFTGVLICMAVPFRFSLLQKQAGDAPELKEAS